MLVIYTDKYGNARVQCEDPGLRRRLNREKVLVVRDASGGCIDNSGDVFDTADGLKVLGYFDTVEFPGIDWNKVAEDVARRDEEATRMYSESLNKTWPERTKSC